MATVLYLCMNVCGVVACFHFFLRHGWRPFGWSVAFTVGFWMLALLAS